MPTPGSIHPTTGSDVAFVTTKQIRRFLSDAYAFIASQETTARSDAYGIEEAVADRIRQLVGPPRVPTRLPKKERLEKLIQLTDSMVSRALQLREEDPSLEAIDRLKTGADGVGDYLRDAVSSLYGDLENLTYGGPAELLDQLWGSGAPVRFERFGIGVDDLLEDS